MLLILNNIDFYNKRENLTALFFKRKAIPLQRKSN